MKFMPRRRTNASIINLTPLIDCMFMLVLFILLAARFEPDSGIPVDLPQAQSQSKEAPRLESMNLTVTADGRVYLEDQEVKIEDLETAIIAARTAAGDPSGERTVLIINGDRSAHHGSVVEALDAAARAKQLKVTIRTRQ